MRKTLITVILLCSFLCISCEREAGKAANNGATSNQKKISNQQVIQDLSYLESVLKERSAYFQISKINLKEEISKIINKSNKSKYTRAEFSIDLQRMIAKIIDGHAHVSGIDSVSKNFLPFLLESVKEGQNRRYVAFLANRESFFNDKYPYIKSINGLSIDEHIKRLDAYFADGTESYVLTTSFRFLRLYEAAYKLIFNKDLKDHKISIVLENEAGQSKSLDIRLSNKFPIYGNWPKSPLINVPKDIGYFRIPEMIEHPKFYSLLEAFMQKHMNSKGIIIDLRRNSGGQRGLLFKLLPYFFAKDQKKYIASVGYCLRFKGCELGSRYMYNKYSRFYSKDDLRFIENFEKSFNPKVKFDKDKFSYPHYLLINSDHQKRFEGKVVVLQDKWNFSATDILLGGLKGLDVTLVGEPSAGGSSARMRYKLPNSGISIYLGRMLSFNRDGQLYDGVGVTPTIPMSYEKEFYIGKSDKVLEYAIDLMVGSTPQPHRDHSAQKGK